MSTLTILTGADHESAKTGFTLSNNNPFQEGKEFQVTGYAFADFVDDKGVKRNKQPMAVLVTTLGPLLLSRLTRKQVDSKGNILIPNGKVNLRVSEIINAPGEDDSLKRLETIVGELKDKPLVCSLHYFPKINGGYEYASAMLNVNHKG